MVSAGAVRDHLERLRQQGAGTRAIADAAGVSRRLLVSIRRGQTVQVQARIARRVLAVKGAISPGANVPAWPTWRTLKTLLAEGYSVEQLSTLLKWRPDRWWQAKTIKGKYARRARRLYEIIMSEDGGSITI
jgi:hypothetical protein